jgi:hypothetical protein
LWFTGQALMVLVMDTFSTYLGKIAQAAIQEVVCSNTIFKTGRIFKKIFAFLLAVNNRDTP